MRRGLAVLRSLVVAHGARRAPPVRAHAHAPSSWPMADGGCAILRFLVVAHDWRLEHKDTASGARFKLTLPRGERMRRGLAVLRSLVVAQDELTLPRAAHAARMGIENGRVA